MELVMAGLGRTGGSATRRPAFGGHAGKIL